MTKSRHRPSRIPTLVLRVLANRRANSAIIGDLEEEFLEEVKTYGERRARRRHWKLLLISLPSLLKNSMIWRAAMIRNYLIIAARNMFRNRLFAVINLLGLAVGMACFILISLWIRDELSYDTFHQKKDRLYLMTIKHPSDVLDRNVPYALATRLADEYPEVEAFTRIYELSEARTCSFRYQNPAGETRMFYENNVVLVDSGFFSMFSFPFVYGSPDTALEDPSGVVLRAEIAAKYFGDENPIGERLTLDNRSDLVITGVIRIPENSSLKFDILAPLEDRMADNWNWADPSYLLLGETADPVAFRAKIANTLERLSPYPQADQLETGILPITKAHLGFGRRLYVYMFSIIAGFILFIACINYMNLATASSSRRAREVGLRKVVGAVRPQLITQFLSESVLMAASGILLSLPLVQMALPWLNRLTNKQLSFFPISDFRMIASLFGLAVLVGIVAGCYPAFFLSSRRPVMTLKSNLPLRSGRSLFRVISVVGQFTLSVVLIAATLAVAKQIRYIQNRPLGLSTHSVVQIRLNPSILRRFRSFKQELLQNPKVLSVTAGQSVPYAEDYKTSGLVWDGKDPELNPNVRYSIAHFDYFKTFDIQIAEGRAFSEETTTDRTQYLINQTAVRYLNIENPIGKRLTFWNREGRIIGVVQDYHHVSLHREIMPQVFTVNPAFYRSLRLIFVKIAADEVPATMDHIRNIAGKIGPEFPFEYQFLDEGMAEMYQNERRIGRLFNGFASLAVVISCLGIFGLAAFTADQRTKEIGIRKVMGASAGRIVGLLSKDFSRWVLLANTIAWPLAYFGLREMMQNYAYRTSIGLGLFALAGLISIGAAALPAVYHSLRAALADPIDSLRYE